MRSICRDGTLPGVVPVVAGDLRHEDWTVRNAVPRSVFFITRNSMLSFYVPNLLSFLPRQL
jgi:hypothetical protein